MDKQLILDAISNNKQMERHEYEFIASHLGSKSFLVLEQAKIQTIGEFVIIVE